MIPLSVPNLKGNEKEYVIKAIEQEWVSTSGSYIHDFENALACYVDAGFTTACQSGTAGLHLSLIANRIGKNQEVIVPTLTFVAAVNPVRYVSAEPIFMDCDDTLCMDMDKLRHFIEDECTFINGKLINNQSKNHVAAVIVVHVFGNMADMEKLMDMAKQYKLIVIEDATEALGSRYLIGRYAGKYAGTIGDIGVFSFNGNKIITTGGGGMVVSNDEEIIKHIRHLSTQAKTDPVYFEHDEMGYNYRMTNLQAAVGLAQLEQLELFIDHKKSNYELYKEKRLRLIPFRSDIRPNYWFYSLLSDKRDELLIYLNDNNIQSRPVWQLMHRLSFYKNCMTYKIEKALHYQKKVLNIPCSSNLTSQQAMRVADCIIKFEGKD